MRNSKFEEGFIERKPLDAAEYLVSLGVTRRAGRLPLERSERGKSKLEIRKSTPKQENGFLVDCVRRVESAAPGEQVIR